MKPKVVILVNSLLAGGAERFVSLVLASLADDFETHLLLLENIIEYDLPPGQIVVDLGTNGVRSADVSNLLRMPFVAHSIKKYCNDNSIQLLVSFSNRPNMAACLAKKFGLKATLFISERTYTAALYSQNSLRGKIGRFITSTLYPWADAILPNSKGSRESLENDFNIKSNYVEIKNAIVIDDIRSKKDESVDDVSFDRFTFVCVGGFRLVKNHRMLVKAFAGVKNQDSQLLLIGTGYKLHGEGYKAMQEIRDMVKSLGLEQRVLFLGQKENPFKYLSRSDCFVLSSDFEGFPNVLLEALSCGLPVISTDCPTGPREILAPGTKAKNTELGSYENGEYGLLVSPGNATAMTSAMEEIIRNEKLRRELTAKSGDRAKEFDSKVVMKEFYQLIANHFCLKEKDPASSKEFSAS